MSEAQQRGVWRRHASAIKKLEPCRNPFASESKGSRGHCSGQPKHLQQPVWDFQPVHLPSSRRLQMHTTSQGKLGQAVLSLPFTRADVALQLPPALQLGATPSGNLDCRMQLLSVTAEWPVCQQRPAADQGSTRAAKLLPAKSAAAGFACRSGALLLAHALFPDHARGLLGWLAVPVAVADGLAVVHSALPESARHAAATGASKLKGRLQGRSKKRRSGSRDADGPSECGVGWLDAAEVTVLGVLHTLRCLSGPAAAASGAGWLWSVLHPSSNRLCTCMLALLAVSADYSQLSNDISRGRLGPGREVEAAWHARHKAAAQRLAHFCGDLPATPPLQPLLHAVSCCSIAAGLAVDGQGLSGAVSGAHSMHSTSASSMTGAVQLLLSASIHPSTDGANSTNRKKHEATGLSRTQLLDLFTGSTDDPLAATCEATCSGAACTCGHQTNASAAGGSLEAARPAHSRHGSTGSASLSTTSTEHSADLTVHVHDGRCHPGHPILEAAFCGCRANGNRLASTAAAQSSQTASQQQQQQQPMLSQHVLDSRPAAIVGRSNCSADIRHLHDPLAFLDGLPLYGQEDHAGGSAVLLAGKHYGVWQSAELGMRAVYLLMVFSPFLLLGVPMLLVAWWLLSRAAAQQQKGGSSSSSRGTPPAADKEHHMAVVSPLPVPPSSKRSSMQQFCTNMPHAAAEAARHPTALLFQLLQQVLSVLTFLAALLDLLLVLLLGGHWAAGVSAWESAGLFLRRRAWQLLLFSSSAAGAAFIKWGQWSASRRDIFPEDFCDTLSALHDRAPVHGFRHSRRLIETAFGKKLDELFITFNPKPLASGSIAQVHCATLRNPSTGVTAAAPQEVVVKVCHPNVYRHICMDFRLLSGLSTAAARIPALRGLSLRESVAQFSHTMTAQTDLRVEAVHALRFHNNFSGVRSSVQIPRPIPGLVSEQVLVESYEQGCSVAVFMKEPSPINSQIVALGVDAFLKMLLVDNFVHTDLHPGNILFRAVPITQQQRRATSAKQRQPQQQASQHVGSERSNGKPWWHFWRRSSSSNSSRSRNRTSAGNEPPLAQWELDLQGMIHKQQQRWASRHAADAAGTSDAITRADRWLAKAAAGTAADDEATRQLVQQLRGGSANSSSAPSAAAQDSALAAQLVLLDFGLAEQLNAEVRHHFISFLNAISAGDGLCAARHLLSWSRTQTCTDTVAFKADVVDLFNSSCNIQSPAGIDLDAVMKAVLSLARKHGVSIDSCYASLVISVCVLVGFATSLDPGVNIMDAATPGLLAYSLTGKVLGRLYS